MQRTQPLLGLVQVAERARYVTPPAADPAEVLLDESQRQILAELPAEPFGLGQVGLGGGELIPLAMQHTAVGQHALHPDRVTGLAQNGKASLVAGQRFAQSAKLVHDRGPLRLGPSLGRAVEMLENGVDLADRALRAASDIEDERQPDPCLRGQRRRAALLAERRGGAQVSHRRVWVLQVERGEPECPCGNRCGVVIA